MIFLILILSCLIGFLFYKKTVPAISAQRQIVLTILRSAFIFFILLLFFNPILYWKQTYTHKPIILSLVDKSNSMNQEIGGVSKYDIVAPFSKNIETLFRESGYEIEHINMFDKNPTSSLLLPEIREVLSSGKHYAGIAIASDGWFHDQQSLFASISNIPIYTYIPAVQSIEPELTIDNLIYSKNARKNEIHTIRANISTKNYSGDINVVIKNDKQNVISRQNIAITDDSEQAQSIEFRVRMNDIGLAVFEIEATGTDGLTAKNFAAIQVLEDKSRILIVSDAVNWEVRLWNRYLNFSDRFETDFIYTDNRGAFRQSGQPATIRWQDYAGFVIVNSQNIRFSQIDVNSLKNKLLEGAGLIYIGSVNPALAEILPARASNIRITTEAQTALRPEALSYQIFRDIEAHWTRFPPVLFHYLTAKEQSVSLVEIADQNRTPVIFLGNFGQGDVLHFAFWGLWRWQLTAEPIVFDRFVNGLAQWIFSHKSDNFFAFTDKNVYYTGEKIRVNLSAFDEKLNPLSDLNARLRLFRDQTEVYSDFMIRRDDLFVVNLPDLTAGTYRYHIADDRNNLETSGSFEVLAMDIESMDRGFNARLLSDLSSSSGGMAFRSENPDYKPTSAENIKLIRNVELPLYKNAFFIALLLAVFCLELYLRKRWNLL